MILKAVVLNSRVQGPSGFLEQVPKGPLQVCILDSDFTQSRVMVVLPS